MSVFKSCLDFHEFDKQAENDNLQNEGSSLVDQNSTEESNENDKESIVQYRNIDRLPHLSVPTSSDDVISPNLNTKLQRVQMLDLLILNEDMLPCRGLKWRWNSANLLLAEKMISANTNTLEAILDLSMTLYISKVNREIQKEKRLSSVDRRLNSHNPGLISQAFDLSEAVNSTTNITSAFSYKEMDVDVESNQQVVDSEKIKSKDESTNTIPLYKLFSFADPLDHLLMFVGTVGAIRNGISMPLMTLIFGNMINAFGGSSSTKEVVDEVSKVSLKFVYLGAGTFVASFLQLTC